MLTKVFRHNTVIIGLEDKKKKKKKSFTFYGGRRDSVYRGNIHYKSSWK